MLSTTNQVILVYVVSFPLGVLVGRSLPLSTGLFIGASAALVWVLLPYNQLCIRDQILRLFSRKRDEPQVSEYYRGGWRRR
jgi:hypothetical protein